MANIRVELEFFIGKIDEKKIREIFKEVSLKILKEKKYSELKDMNSKMSCLLDYALTENSSVFPIISVKPQDKIEDKLIQYFQKWCQKFLDDRLKDNVAKPLKEIGERDPALITKVQSYTKEDDSKVEEYLKGHFLFMSAENNNGSILEEFLASVLEDHGWIWCSGSSYRSIDFFQIKKRILLQVKNKYNTENSSSNKIRKGTNIKKWNRLNKPTQDTNKPVPNWAELHKIIDDDDVNNLLSEEKYLKFIKCKNNYRK